MIAEFEALEALVPPPPGVVPCPTWEAAREEIGFVFPSDYRAFVDAYGGGYFATPETVGLVVWAPHSQPLHPGGAPAFRGFVDWHNQVVRPLFCYEGAVDEMWGGRPRALYPETGGLLAWGYTEQSDHFFWSTANEDPDHWTVVMWSSMTGEVFEFDGGMVGFLVALFSGQHETSSAWESEGLGWTIETDWLRDLRPHLL